MLLKMVKACLLSILVLWGFHLGAQENRQFIRLEEHGLSNHAYNLVPAVQDSLGYVWVSNVFGINKFDGFAHEFIPFREIFGWESKGDEIEQLVTTPSGRLLVSSYKGFLALKNEDDSFHSLSTANGPFREYAIGQMMAGNHGIWLITRDGELLSFEEGEEEPIRLTHIPEFKVNRDRVTGMEMDKEGMLYMSTNSGRLFVYDTGDKQLEEIPLDLNDAYVHYTDLALGENGDLWICTSSREVGIKVYRPATKRFVEDEPAYKELVENSRAASYKILCGKGGKIWVASDGDGLYGIDVEERRVENFRFDAYSHRSLSSNTIMDLFEDSNHNLWIFHIYGRIDILPKADSGRNVVTYKGALNENTIIVQSVIKSSDGSLWMGTDGQGLVKVAPDGTTKEQYLINEDFSQGFLVQSITEDGNGMIWVATINDGVWLFDPQKKKETRFPIVDEAGLNGKIISLVYKDNKGRIWVSANNGIVVYDTEYNPIARFGTEDFEGDVHCTAMVQSGDGNLWLGLRSGLYRLEEDDSNLDSSSFTRFSFFDETIEDAQALRIRTLTTDNHRKIWIVTNHFRLHVFDYVDKTYSHFDPDLTIERPLFQSVQVQDSNSIWTGTNEGLWHFDLLTKSHKKYDRSDGFSDNRYLLASYKDDQGKFYFASSTGMNYFDPAVLSKSEVDAKLNFTAIDIQGKPARAVLPEQLENGISKIRHLSLTNDQSSFSFRFQAIDNLLSPNYNYSYKLVGFDREWRSANNSRTATYTNIPSGDYEFIVRAGNELGAWNLGEKAIRIHIDRPPYLQWWALILYGLILLGIGLAVFRWLLLKRNLALERMAHERDAEVYDMKMNFFAKLSHEIQTPLTLILLPLEELWSLTRVQGNTFLESRLRGISFNAKRLSRLVFELTTIRNKELDRPKLTMTGSDFVDDLKKIVASFEPWAERESIKLQLIAEPEVLEMEYDRQKIQHVIYNLLTNAFKFTPKGGSITVESTQKKNAKTLVVTVRDTGRGIEKEELTHIFDLFYQTGGGYREGMGIGLALSKELIRLHGGEIQVESEKGKGTCFTVTLPVRAIDPTLSNEGSQAMPLLHEGPVSEAIGATPFEKQEATLLVVEDDLELQGIIAAELGMHYKVLVASDGGHAYALAKKYLPELILSDVMMPEVNGIELSKKLQRNKMTAHIPIVLLTADSSDITKIKGLRSGVIDSLAKPFQMQELLLKTHNIIQQTNRVQRRAKTEALASPSETPIKSKDDLLLDKVMAIVDQNLEDSNFKVETIASELHMGYSSLIRKFQSITGHTLVDFVRTVRLKKAAKFLSEGKYSVSEAAYAVGFSDVKYFSKCFKRLYGKSPAAFKKDPSETSE